MQQPDDLDREMAVLLAGGMSYRQTAAEVGRSLGFVQRAVKRFERARLRVLASVAATGRAPRVTGDHD